jgi:GxxExxY protein
MAESNLKHADLTHNIIGAAREVHSQLGPGFLESVYEESLAIELDLHNIKFERQKPLNVFYKGRPAKQFICDILVDNRVLIELKAVKELTSIDKAQLLNYLKAANIKVGLLINFGQSSLKFHRVVL